jgi:hypothetical protein
MLFLLGDGPAERPPEVRHAPSISTRPIHNVLLRLRQSGELGKGLEKGEDWIGIRKLKYESNEGEMNRIKSV